MNIRYDICPRYAIFLSRLGSCQFLISKHGVEVDEKSAPKRKRDIESLQKTWAEVPESTIMNSSTTFEPFADGDIETYLDRLDQHFIAHDLVASEANAPKRRAILHKF